MWMGKDSNLRRREPTDLQSVPVDRFGTHPYLSRCAELNRGPTPYHGVALPAELQRRYKSKKPPGLEYIKLTQTNKFTLQAINLLFKFNYFIIVWIGLK